MKREELEHVIRACAGITNEYEFVIIGSQSILGALPNAPAELLESMEVDVYPLNRPELWELIDGSIGEGSPFHVAFNYYAQGVGPETAILPEGWRERLVRVQNQNTGNFIGLCISPSDLAASKLVAGREKDWVFVRCMLAKGAVNEKELERRVADLPIDDDHKQSLQRWIRSNGPSEALEP